MSARSAFPSIERDDGFTLIELMVVVLILGILLAIGLPTFLGARTRAQDSAAKQAATLALEAAKIVYTDHSDYTEATATALEISEPSLTYVDAGVPSTDGRTVSRDAIDEDSFTAAVWSASGTCFFIREQPTAGIDYGTISGGTNADCSAGNAAAATFTAQW